MSPKNTFHAPEITTLQNISNNKCRINSSNTLQLQWTISSNATEVVARYCSHCGKVVQFSDSGYRRQNANGKNIFHFAIYKCEKGHTWNNKIEQFTAKSHLTNVPLNFGETEIETETQTPEKSSLLLADVKAQGYSRIQIKVDISKGKHRLDKVLSERLETLSRTHLVKQIDAGFISLDGCPAKGKSMLSGQHLIVIDLEALALANL